MKIASAALQLDSTHVKQQEHTIRESLRRWAGSAENEGRPGRAPRPPELVSISTAGQAAQSNEAEAIQSAIDAAENDPMLRLIRSMIALLTGEDVRVFDAKQLPTDTPAAPVQNPNQSSPGQGSERSAGPGGEYTRHESYTESEATSFEATGVVRTEDGKEISFTLSLAMSRSYHEESDLSIRFGDSRQTKDPLVLNFGGSAAQLTSQRFKFDLDTDGKTEDINFVAGGSGFLALDKNGDGKINNGSELFGAATGNGFAELSALDSDHNGWIDENDAAYGLLRVWTKDAAGNDQLATLQEANVGALSLASTATPFDLKDSRNALLGQIRSSGIFLQENGVAGTIQQVDLTV